jgi:hypothetical protein
LKENISIVRTKKRKYNETIIPTTTRTTGKNDTTRKITMASTMFVAS